MKALAALILACGLAGCGVSGSTSHASFADLPSDEFDEDDARETATADMAAQTYQDSDMTFGCTEDCSGHDAGWAYQAEQGYGADYGGRSQSFSEGREAFDDAVDARVEEMRQDHEEGRVGEDDDY